MKRIALVAAALSAGISLPAGNPLNSIGKQDLVDTAIAAGNFGTLVKAVSAAGLVKTLKGGTFTVFAPTDEAFAKLPRKTLRALLRPENRGRLQAILTYHVVAGKVPAKAVINSNYLKTVNGQRLSVRADAGRVRVGNSGVQSTDIKCTNGIIHVIDTVLIPADMNLVQVAKKAGSFQTLLQAASAAGLVDALVGQGPLTVFAPTDAAFRKIPKKTLKSLLEPKGRSQLAAILKYHVVPGRVYSDQAVVAGAAKTLQSDSVRIGLVKGRLQINGAKVLANDVESTNGVIHVIDTVLMPPKRGRKVVGVTLSRPGAALAAQLGIERNAALVVTSVSANAKAAGLRKYDVLTEIAGRAATNGNLDRAKRDRGFGERIPFRVRRGSKSLKIEIPIASKSH